MSGTEANVKAKTIRDPAVDVVRGIAIMLVVLGHSNRGLLGASHKAWTPLLRVLDLCLYTVHMPTFFYLAGYFTSRSLARHGVPVYLKSRWSSLIYPYLIWSMITVAAHQVGAFFLSIHHLVNLRDLLSLAWAPINVLWFLYALLVLQLLASGLCRRVRVLLILCIAFSAAFTVSSYGSGQLIAKTAAEAPFFALGFLRAKRGEEPAQFSLTGKLTMAITVLGIFFISCVGAHLLGVRDPSKLYMLPASLLGIAGLAGLAAWTVRKAPTWIASHLRGLGTLSLPIYLLHSFLLAVVPRLLQAIGFDTVVAELALGTAVGVYGSWGSYLAIERLRLTSVLGLRVDR